MAGQGESCLFGALGCTSIVIGGGVLLALVGGHFHIDLGGVLLLLVLGGVLGLFINGVYEKGRRKGLDEAGSSPTLEAPEPAASSGRRKTPTFVSPWGVEVPPTVSDALSRLTEKYWSRDHPDVRISERGVNVSFRSRGVDDDRVIELEAADTNDVVTIRLRDGLGEIFAPTGPWRSVSDSNADLIEAFHFVESVFMEEAVHVLTSSGEHRLVLAAHLDGLMGQDTGAQVRSWNGTLDRYGA